jgi:hypothetical protein
MRRVLDRLASPDPKRGKVPGCPADIADKEEIARWADENPGKIYTMKQIQNECHPG